MEKILIIYPAIAMFFLTFSMIINLGISRVRAIKNREISIKYYQKYTEGEQPDRLHILGRHVQNHFEVPPLFYVGVILLFITNTVTLSAVIFAWLFFSFRCVHAYVHLGKNNVNHRFVCFGGTLLSLAGLWACLFIQLLSNA